MQADGIEGQCHLSICSGVLTIHCSTLDRSARLAIYNSESSVFALLHDIGARQLQECVSAEGVEGPEKVVAEPHLLLTPADRRELEAEQDTPEHRIGIRVGTYGSDEEVVEAEERETSAMELRDESEKKRDSVETHPSNENPATRAASARALVAVGSGFAFAPLFKPSHSCVPPDGVVTL